MSMPGLPQLLVIFLFILIFFGAKRIPEIARGLGKGLREFKDATREIGNELSFDDRPQVQSPRPPEHGAPMYRGEGSSYQGQPPYPQGQPPYQQSQPPYEQGQPPHQQQSRPYPQGGPEHQAPAPQTPPPHVPSADQAPQNPGAPGGPVQP